MKAIVCSVLFVIASVSLAMAQGTYTQIDFPGSVDTLCEGINHAGDITGGFDDASFVRHGFLLRAGNYSTIDYPGALLNTTAYGINDANQIVGSTLTSSGEIGFVYDVTTTMFASVIYPNAATTIAYGINNLGAISGTFQSKGNLERGFELLGSAYHNVAFPHATYSAVFGIAGSGVVVGTAGQNSGGLIFLFSHGSYTKVALGGTPGAVAYGITSQPDALVGSFNPTPTTSAGFVYQNQALVTIQFPGSSYTTATGINDVGQVVGYFVDSSGKPHGFIWTPPSDAATK